MLYDYAILYFGNFYFVTPKKSQKRNFSEKSTRIQNFPKFSKKKKIIRETWQHYKHTKFENYSFYFDRQIALISTYNAINENLENL